MKYIEILFNKFVEFYKIHRGNDYYRITLYSLVIPIAIFTTSILDVVLNYFSIRLNIPDIFIPPIYGLYTLAIIFLFFIICYFIDTRNRPLNPHIRDIEEQKREHDKIVVNKIISIVDYDYFKDKLENAHNGVDWAFVDKLTELEYYLSPKYKLYNTLVEKLRMEFLILAEKFNSFLSVHLYTDYGNTDRLIIPPEWLRDSRIKLYMEHEKKISEKAHYLFQVYRNFYEAAKDEMFIDAA